MRKSVRTCVLVASVHYLLLATATACADAPARVPLVRNLVTDYAAGEANKGSEAPDIAQALQRAVDDVGAAGGGTIVIPARAGGWQISRPVFVGHPNVTIAGEGGGTRISGGGTIFLLGVRQHEPQAESAGHFPLISGPGGTLDGSVKTPRYGLRTIDGRASASGYFPACPLAFGSKIPQASGTDEWKNYEAGSGQPTYWRHWPTYTINLAVRNNAAALMKGTVCGVGAGGLTPALTHGNIDDPLTVWTIESDPVTGKDLAFRFKVVDGQGKESLQSLPLAAGGSGMGTHRISVQLDLTSGRCRAWYSASDQAIEPMTLAGKLDLGLGWKLKAFEYGAFQLGRVTGRMFSGAPGDADWTFSGMSLFSAGRYKTGGEHDRVGAAQERAAGEAKVDDTYRFFPPDREKSLVIYLPLVAAPTDLLVSYQLGQEYGGLSGGYGFWTPERRSSPIAGTIALRDMHVFSNSSNVGIPIGIGESAHAVIENVYSGAGGFQGVGGLPVSGIDRRIDVRNCRLVGADAALFAYDQTVHGENIDGGGGETMFRFVGCQGFIDSALVTGFSACDYYAKFHAGARGGPMRVSQFCIDNEGISWAPRKACFYAEPSLDGGPQGNRLTFPGTLYTGSLLANQAVVELAGAPGGAKATGVVEIDGVDLGVSTKHPARCIILAGGDQWSGTLRLAEERWDSYLSDGVIAHTTDGPCNIVSYHQVSTALPSEGKWLAGCHVFRVADHQDGVTGAWAFKTYRCVATGRYGTKQEPKWELVKRGADVAK